MNDQVTPQQFIVFLFALACGVTLACGYWYWAFGTGPVRWALILIRSVKGLLPRPPVVMSRSEESTPLPSPSSLQTDNRQTDRQPAQAQPGRAELLTLYKTMREAGIGREKARSALKAVGLPLDNNLWAEAAPAQAGADDTEYRTPIVGRPTSAQFETDRDFPYQAPA